MKKVAIVIVLVLVAAVGLLAKRKADLAKAPTAPVLPVVVEAAKLAPGQVRLTLPAMGLVASQLSTTLSTKVSGQVVQVLKQEGDPVKKGEVLATIEAQDLSAKEQGLRDRRQGLTFQIAALEENVKAAVTAIDAARDTHKRTLELLAVKGASVEESRREESEIAGLEAKLAAARNGVSTMQKEQESLDQGIKEVAALASYATVTAPIDGTVSQRLVQAGDLAQPGKPLFKIAAKAGRYVNLSLPDTTPATAIILEGRTLPLTAKNEAGSTGLCQYLAPLPAEIAAVEGQYLNLRVVIYQDRNVLVPADALLGVDGESFVLSYANHRAVKTRVDIVAQGREGVVVRQDLSGQEVLLAKPDILLRAAAGVPVRLATEPQAASPNLDGGRDNG